MSEKIKKIKIISEIFDFDSFKSIKNKVEDKINHYLALNYNLHGGLIITNIKIEDPYTKKTMSYGIFRQVMVYTK